MASKPKPKPKPRPAAFLALAAALACGCPGEPPADPGYDPGIARQTLVTALDAWKAGEQNALAKRDPPVRLSDEDENDGCRLLEYELILPDAEVRPYGDIPVRLVLRDTRGRKVIREANYQVALEPERAVIRADP